MFVCLFVSGYSLILSLQFFASRRDLIAAFSWPTLCPKMVCRASGLIRGLVFIFRTACVKAVRSCAAV